MATTDRERDADLKPDAFEGLDRLGFFQLVHFLDHAYPEAPRIGETGAAAREKVRFKANPSLGFPPSEVESVAPSGTIPGGLDVILNVIGLFGPASPLPTSVTERVVHAEGTNALGDFLDLFNHRFAGLLALTGTHYRHDLRYQPGAADPISQFVGALFGLPPDAPGAAADPRRKLLLPYAGLLSLYGRSAAGIAGVVTYALGITCRLEEFVTRRMPIPGDAQFVMGGPPLELGIDTIIGETMEDVGGQFRVWLGPLSGEAFRSLLPGQPRCVALQELLHLVVRDPLCWDIGYVLAPDAAGSWSLGAGELGWTSWIDPPAGEALAVVL